nr:flagellar basal body rod C-terminal domain-containing protein [Nocardioides perillae]
MHQTWLDSLANNISNANTVKSTDEEAFRSQMVVARARPGGGVEVAGIAEGDPEGRLVHSPDHPLADAEGYVRLPEVDMASQMSQLVMAQRGFQAAVQVTKNAQETYSSALTIGRA